jgi:protein-tyrosine phosphatase
MDDENHSILMAACPSQLQYKIHYFLDYAPQLNIREVPDPYYGSGNGFERVLDMIEAASEGFLQHLHDTKKLG